MTTPQPAPDRPLRADARRNRERILDVADAVFGEAGQAASTEEIARRAGVGIGTVFRHFPTKEALLEAVFVRRLTGLRDRAAQQLDARDPGQAFSDFFTLVVRDAPAKLAIAGALADSGANLRTAVHDAHQELRAAFGRLLERAQAAGAVRRDVELAEVYALLIGTSRAAAAADVDDRVLTGTLRIVFDGLRATRS
ncbi:TetR/AcrR family transcriptional regulator [Saccharopolyspora sp. K220]|uniref:TetR/AcrR family transcriptional regulator n=1 Tax=Saccharopolyspora soli TaxID=2926618 RepID=UPI001F5899B6|nr:TetR/AcrR family transcriptional regulator [Saccharopolyspora soli]MCI2419058.1 TetR/AcrR family transcriptional regulator [Saccharopolyspora soli]